MYRPARTSCSRCLCPDGRTIRHDVGHRSGTLAPRNLIPVTNPIETPFATVRHRTIRSKGCLSNKTALAMVFKLVEGAQKNWRRIDGNNQLPKLIQDIRFTDRIEVIGNTTAPQAQAAA